MIKKHTHTHIHHSNKVYFRASWSLRIDLPPSDNWLSLYLIGGCPHPLDLYLSPLDICRHAFAPSWANTEINDIYMYAASSPVSHLSNNVWEKQRAVLKSWNRDWEWACRKQWVRTLLTGVSVYFVLWPCRLWIGQEWIQCREAAVREPVAMATWHHDLHAGQAAASSKSMPQGTGQCVHVQCTSNGQYTIYTVILRCRLSIPSNFTNTVIPIMHKTGV